MKPINERISANLIALRKNAKMTQLEFAEKINYSDKAVSKWENGDSIPSVEVLENICNIFDITLNDLTSEKSIAIQQPKKRKMSPNKVIIVCLAMIFIWLLATILFVCFQLVWNVTAWILFVWAVPGSLLVGLIFNFFWGQKKNVALLVSLITWTLLASVYLSILPQYNVWIIFILGVPIQILVILWTKLNRHDKTTQELSDNAPPTGNPPDELK